MRVHPFLPLLFALERNRLEYRGQLGRRHRHCGDRAPGAVHQARDAALQVCSRFAFEHYYQSVIV